MRNVPALVSGETSLLLVNINWIIKGDGEQGGSSSHAMTTATEVAGVSPDWIVQFPRRKSLRVLQLQLQLRAPPCGVNAYYRSEWKRHDR